MRRFLRGTGVVLAVIAITATPLWIANRKGVDPQLVATEKLVPLLAAFLVSTAFVGALYTSFSNDKRLRANSGKVLVTLIFFATAVLLMAVALLLTAVGASRVLNPIVEVVTYLGIIIYFLTFGYLLVGVFLPTYNQVYNLRTNKLYKYFPPVPTLRAIFARDERYETNDPIEREDTGFDGFQDVLTPEERTHLAKGGAVLLTGASTNETLFDAIDLIEERLRVGETANYVCCDRHPYEVWKIWKERRGSNQEDVQRRRRGLVFIDAYSPSFAFTDDIQRENDKRLTAEGVSYVKAHAFAGLHTAVNSAFHIIKRKAREDGTLLRRPHVMIYTHTSALCDFESVEQFRVFWRHVIPSERSYGMATFIIEDEHAGDDILGPLKQRVDFVVSYARTDEGDITRQREK